jgi:hypothetical protein
MARMMREVVVCDVCGSDQNVATVSVALNGEQQTADLCATHGGQLREAVAGVLGGTTGETARLTRRRRGRKAAAGQAVATKGAPRRATAAAAKPSRMPRTTCPHCGMDMGVQNLSRHVAAKHPEAA